MTGWMHLIIHRQDVCRDSPQLQGASPKQRRSRTSRQVGAQATAVGGGRCLQ